MKEASPQIFARPLKVKRPHNFKDLTGQRFGRLVAIEILPPKNGNTRWRFKCDCGIETEQFSCNVTRGHTGSCGCAGDESRRTACLIHGMSHTPEHNAWMGMLARCYNPKHRKYPHYGGRGITVCERWKNSFPNFFEDMGPRASSKLSIDRIEVNGNYEPSNCRWATQLTQQRNRRNTRK